MNRWARHIEPFGEWVTDTGTAGALWPFAVGSQQPIRGVPLGYDPTTNRLVCYDPLTEFTNGTQRAAQLAVLAANGLGKSALCKRLVTGLQAADCPPVIPADFKGEYGELVTYLGGSAQRISRSGGINLVDPGEIIHMASLAGVTPEVLGELQHRRNNLVSVVLSISRGTPLADWERSILGIALDMLGPGETTRHLASILNDRIDDLAATMNVPVSRAHELVEPLQLSTMALINSPVGQATGTSSPQQFWAIGNGLCVDTQTIPEDEKHLTAAITVTCWTAALSAIFFANQFNPRVYTVLFEEIWRATRQFPDLADRIGGLLRMDRHEGIISILATHSWSDTQQRGGSNILNRCAAFAIGGQQPEEIETISHAGLGLTKPELAIIRQNITGGTTPNGQPYGGMGRFLIKQGDQPGQLVQTVLSPAEMTLSHTNTRFNPVSASDPEREQKPTVSSAPTPPADTDTESVPVAAEPVPVVTAEPVPVEVEPASPVVVAEPVPVAVEPAPPVVVAEPVPVEVEPAPPVVVAEPVAVAVEPAPAVAVEPAPPVEVQPVPPVAVKPTAPPVEVEPAPAVAVEPAPPVEVEPVPPVAVKPTAPPVEVEPVPAVQVKPAPLVEVGPIPSVIEAGPVPSVLASESVPVRVEPAPSDLVESALVEAYPAPSSPVGSSMEADADSSIGDDSVELGADSQVRVVSVEMEPDSPVGLDSVASSL